MIGNSNDLSRKKHRQKTHHKKVSVSASILKT
jgi:hypothetical protein